MPETISGNYAMRIDKSYILALLAIFLWSTAGTAFKLALKTIDFSQLLLISANVAWLTLALFALIKRKRIHLDPVSLRKSAINGFLNPFLYYLVLLKAYSLLPAQIAQPLNYTWPLMLVILSVIFLNHKLKWFDMIAVLISFSGVVVISMMGKFSFTPDKAALFGIILATGSSIIWASYWILNVKDKREELEKILLNFFFGGIFITSYCILTQNFPKPSLGWLPATYVGFTEMAIAFVLWLTALKKSTNNSRIGNLVFISPFLALIFIHLILKESIYLSTIAGLILIVTGILFQQFMANKRHG